MYIFECYLTLIMGSIKLNKLNLNPEKVKDAVGTVYRNWALFEIQPYLEGLNSL